MIAPVNLHATARRGVVAWVRGEQALVCGALCLESAEHFDAAARSVVVAGSTYSPQAASRRTGRCAWCNAELRGPDASVQPKGK